MVKGVRGLVLCKLKYTAGIRRPEGAHAAILKRGLALQELRKGVVLLGLGFGVYRA